MLCLHFDWHANGGALGGWPVYSAAAAVVAADEGRMGRRKTRREGERREWNRGRKRRQLAKVRRRA